MLLIAAAAVLTALVADVEAKVYGAPGGASGAPHVVAPPVQASMPPKSPNVVPGAAFDGLPAGIEQATQDAAANGATVSVAVLDRTNNQLLANGNDQLVPIASVAKLFIADEVLSQESGGAEENRRLSTADREGLDSMLRSYDGAAETLWAERGGEAIITDVAGRYRLTSTAPPSDGR
jgi:beta-lactamase class A